MSWWVITMYNRNNIHNKTHNRRKVDEKQEIVLLSLFDKKVHRDLARLYYVEGYSLSECAEIMCFSKRQVERFKSEMNNIAFYSLLELVVQSQNTFKLLAIKNILLGG